MFLKYKFGRDFFALLILILSIIILIVGEKNKRINMDQATVIETVIYQTNPGVNDKEHLKKAVAISPILEKFPGFISRQFSKTADGKWIDIIYWRDLSSAQQAAEEVKTIPECQVFFAEMDEKTMRFMHSKILSTYP